MNRIARWLKKYFIPHQGNDFRAHFLRHQTVTLLFFAVILVELGFLVQTFVLFDKTKFLASVLPGVLTTLTNEARADNHLSLLTENSLLDEAARLKAEDMATLGYFAHTSPDGRTPWSWLTQVGYRYSSAGENLAVNFFESEDVTRAWMDSPTHRANILKYDFTEIGIGIASGTWEGRDTIFVAQFFGKPAPVFAAPAEVVSAPVAASPEPVPTSTTTPPSAPLLSEGGEGGGNSPEPVIVLGSEVPAPEQKPSQNSVKTTLEKALTSPRQSVTYVYLLIAALVILALFLTFFIRMERRHPAALARGVALFAVVIILLYVNLRVHNYKTLVPSDLSANVIEVLQ